MSESDKPAALRACEDLYAAYVEYADTPEAEAFANVFTVDGVFDRLGQILEGRPAIAAVIASRPARLWTKHRCSNIRIEFAADGRSALGHADLELQRGRGDTAEPTVHGVYEDRLLLTDEGWRFASRKVTLIS